MCKRHREHVLKHGTPRAIRVLGTGTIHKGYKLLYKPGHPNAGKSGWIPEHRFKMSSNLGRPLLPHENVHHRNGNKLDNSDENLELWITKQPYGQRVEDQVVWAKYILNLYGEANV